MLPILYLLLKYVDQCFRLWSTSYFV